jgi:hypothetical protein
VGLMLSYALNLSFSLVMVTRLSSQTENSFNAVERLLHYGETVSAWGGRGGVWWGGDCCCASLVCGLCATAVALSHCLAPPPHCVAMSVALCAARMLTA